MAAATATSTPKPLTIASSEDTISTSRPMSASSPRSNIAISPPSPSASALPPPSQLSSTLDELSSLDSVASLPLPGMPAPTIAVIPHGVGEVMAAAMGGHGPHDGLLDELSDAARETAARALHDQHCFLDDTEVAAFPYRTMEALFPSNYPPPKSFKPKQAKAALRRGLYPTQRLIIYERIFYQMSRGRLPLYQTSYASWFAELNASFPILPHTPMDGILTNIPLFGADDWRTRQHFFLADHNSTLEHLHTVKVPPSLVYATERILFFLGHSLPMVEYCPPISSLSLIFLLLGASEATVYSFLYSLLAYNHIKPRAATADDIPSMLARTSPRNFHSISTAPASPRSVSSTASATSVNSSVNTAPRSPASRNNNGNGASSPRAEDSEDAEDGDESYLPQSKESHEHLLAYLSAYILKQEKSSLWLFQLMGLDDISKTILRPYFENFFLPYLPLGTIVRFIDCWLMKGEKLFLRALWAIVRLHARAFHQRFKARQGQFSPAAFRLLSAQMAAEPLLKETYGVWLSSRQMSEISKIVSKQTENMSLAPMITPTALMDQKLWLYLWGHLPSSLSSLKPKNLFNTSSLTSSDYSRFFSTSSSQAFRGLILLLSVHYRAVSGAEESKEADAVVGAVLPFKSGVDNPFGFKLGKEQGTAVTVVEIDSNAFLFESLPQKNIFNHVAVSPTASSTKESTSDSKESSKESKESSRRYPLQLLLNSQQTAIVDESCTLVLHFSSGLDRVVSSGTTAFSLPVPLFKNAVAGHGVTGASDEYDDGKCLWAVKDQELRKQVSQLMLGGQMPKTAAASSATIQALECWSFS